MNVGEFSIRRVFDWWCQFSGIPISAAQFVLKYQAFQIDMLNQMGFPLVQQNMKNVLNQYLDVGERILVYKWWKIVPSKASIDVYEPLDYLCTFDPIGFGVVFSQDKQDGCLNKCFLKKAVWFSFAYICWRFIYMYFPSYYPDLFMCDRWECNIHFFSQVDFLEFPQAVSFYLFFIEFGSNLIM